MIISISEIILYSTINHNYMTHTGIVVFIQLEIIPVENIEPGSISLSLALL